MAEPKINERFGIWTLLEYTGYKLDSKGNRNKSGLFICDCGFKKNAFLSRMKFSKNEKCRGYDRHYYKPEIIDGFRTLEQSCLDNARNKFKFYYSRYKLQGEKIDISFEDFLDITQKNCFYCGKEPLSENKQKCKGGRRGKYHPEGSFKYNGIGRIVMSKGIVLGNIRPCCHECSKAKLDMDEKDFIQWIKQVYITMFPYG